MDKPNAAPAPCLCGRQTCGECRGKAAPAPDADGRHFLQPGEPIPDPTVRRFACFTREDGVYESANGEHVAYTDYAALRATVEQQARELAARDAAIAEIVSAYDAANTPPHSANSEAYEQFHAAMAAARALIGGGK